MNHDDQVTHDLQDEDSNDDDFNAGFSDEASAPTTTPDAPAAEESSAPLIEDAPAPKLAAITEDEYQQLLAKANAIEDVRADSKKLADSLNGRYGSMQQALNKLQSGGDLVELTRDDFAEMAESFPDLAEILARDFNKVQGKVRLRGGSSALAFDAEQVEQLLQQRLTPALEQMQVQQEVKLLRAYHRDWQEVNASPEFAQWRDALPQSEREALMQSTDAAYIADKIDVFKEARKQAASKTAVRGSRLAAAVAPRGVGGHAAAPTEEDEFLRGFNSP